jgi:hypothetical protein
MTTAPGPARPVERDDLPEGVHAVYFPATRVIIVRPGLDEVTRARVIREAPDCQPRSVAS